MNVFPTPASPTTQHYPKYVSTLPRQEGRTIAITGCTSGTGQVLARTCGDLGARVVMLNRPSGRADAALSDLLDRGADAVMVGCDLQEFASVRRAATELRSICPNGLDALCNNATRRADPRLLRSPAGKSGRAERLPQERDPEAEVLLWAESLDAVGLSSFFG